MSQQPELLPCPFCGSAAKYHDHGYSDDYCSVGCSNDDCPVSPCAHAKPESRPWDDTRQTFYVLWGDAEEKAANLWNTRHESDHWKAKAEQLLALLEEARDDVSGMLGGYEVAYKGYKQELIEYQRNFLARVDAAIAGAKQEQPTE